MLLPSVSDCHHDGAHKINVTKVGLRRVRVRSMYRVRVRAMSERSRSMARGLGLESGPGSVLRSETC